MSLVLVVGPRPEREIATLRKRLGAIAAVIGDPDPDQQTRMHADLLVLVGLPWVDAQRRLNEWRAEGLDRLVILALTDAPRAHEALDLGPVEVVAPLFLEEAISSALSSRGSSRLHLSGCEVDLARRTVRRDGQVVALTSQEARLLAWLAARPGQDVTREALLCGVWGYQRSVPTRAVDMAIFRLRRKIERNSSDPDHIQASRGDGYRFVPLARARASAPAPIEPLTPFFGRSDDLEALRACWESGWRLVALVGAPGVGKTRLAQQAVRELGAGAVWCELRHATGGPEVIALLAGALGLNTSGLPAAEVQQVLGEALEGSELNLLVLDAVEHLLEPLRPLIAGWLAQAPKLKILVTTRARPGFAGEVVREVAPLSTEDARALFLDRAAAAGWSGAGQTSADVLDNLVSLLDCLPLALELAAARARALSPRDLVARLHGLFHLLSEGHDRGDSRHTSLRGALAWSWALLPPAARDALAQLSVFGGSFTLASAEAVLRDGETPVAHLLTDLVDHSLVLHLPNEGRYRLLFSVVAFAAEEGSPELIEEARRRHARWMAFSAKRWLLELKRESALAAVETLKLEQANLRAAWSALLRGPADLLVDVARALDALWSAVGTLDQRSELWEETMPCLPEQGVPRALALATLGRLRFLQGRSAESDQHFQEAIALFGAAGEVTERCDTLFVVAGNLRRRGRIAEAQRAVDELARVADGAPHLVALAEAEGSFLVCLREVDEATMASARRRLTRAARLLLSAGDLASAAIAWLLVVTAHELRGDIEQAMQASDQLGAIVATRPAQENRHIWAYQRVVLDLIIGRYASALEGARRLVAEGKAAGRRAHLILDDSVLAAALHGIGNLGEAYPVWERSVAQARIGGSPRLALSSSLGIAMALLEEERMGDARELIEDGHREAVALELGRMAASFALMRALLCLGERRLEEAHELLAAMQPAMLRHELLACRALLQIATARALGLDDADARAALAEQLRGPAFAGKEALPAVLEAFEGRDADALRLYMLPPAPPILRLAAARLRVLALAPSAAPRLYLVQSV